MQDYWLVLIKFNLSVIFQLLQDEIFKQVQVSYFGIPHLGDSYSGDFFIWRGSGGRHFRLL